MLKDELLTRMTEMGAAVDYPRLAADVLRMRGVPPALARQFVMKALETGDRRERWHRVAERVRTSAPAVPGVYVLRDDARAALYVGKAANLRRRLGAQFADRRWRSLNPALARVVDVEWVIVGSEIEALIREAELIRTLRPVANVQIGAPVLRTRAIPRALLRDVVVIAPSVEEESAELLAARADGGTILQRTTRAGTDLALHAQRLWGFFAPSHGRAGAAPAPSLDRAGAAPDHALAPMVFSWLAGRGRQATRLDPHGASSAADLQARLAGLLSDRHLFVERLIPLR